jgi:hypothetical protein
MATPVGFIGVAFIGVAIIMLLLLDRKGLMGWVCLSVCMSRLYCSTWKTICLKEIEEAGRNASWQL